MKKHRARILAMQAVFQSEFHTSSDEDLTSFNWIDYPVPEPEAELARKLILGVKENLESIDNIIREFSVNWDFSRITPVSRAILRLSIYQLRFQSQQPEVALIIDEALRLAREYAEDDAGRFINGVLDSVAQNKKKPKK